MAEQAEGIKYFPTGEPKWDEEIFSVARYLQGSPKGIDVGCGRRSIHADMFRVDINPDVAPDLVASAESLVGVAEDEYDFYFSSHNIEHCEDTAAVLRTAARVVKPGGYVVLIIPSKMYTKGLDPTHRHEWYMEEFLGKWARPQERGIPLALVDCGVAAANWSFRIVYKVMGEGVPKPERTVQAIIREGQDEVAPRDWGLQPARISGWGDHVGLTTGFGQVNKMICQGFHRAGFLLSFLGIWHHRSSRPGEYPYYVEPVCPHDIFGLQKSKQFFAETAPEVIYSLGDPSTQFDRLAAIVPTFAAPGLRLSGFKPPCPLLLYMPIEGTPIARQYLEVIDYVQSNGGKVIVYTKCQAEAIQQQSDGKLVVDWVWHGSDHGPFQSYSEERRANLRRQCGIEDRFVVVNVARNKRTNRQTEYIKAAKLLREAGHEDVVFYLHCNPADEYGIQAMQGCDLEGYAKREGVWGYEGEEAHKNMVLFPPRRINQLQGIRYSNPPGTDLQGLKGEAFDQMSFIDRLNIGNMYMDASSVQGFGLPLVEAMRCGLPAFVTDDSFTRREICGDAVRWMHPYATDTWQTGATLHLVSAKEIAAQVIWAKENPTALAEMREMSVERAAQIKWRPAQDKFVAAVKDLVGQG